MILTESEYTVLDKIATKSKMDCWFQIRQDNGEDYVYDLEEGKRLSLKEGVNMLSEGVDYALCGLTPEEICVYESLLIQLGLKKR